MFRAVDYRRLHTGDAGLAYAVERDEKGYTLRVAAQGYAHAAAIALPEGCTPSDNCFDLLPGETREIRIETREPLDPEPLRVSCVNAPAGERFHVESSTAYTESR